MRVLGKCLPGSCPGSREGGSGNEEAWCMVGRVYVDTDNVREDRGSIEWCFRTDSMCYSIIAGVYSDS